MNDVEARLSSIPYQREAMDAWKTQLRESLRGELRVQVSSLPAYAEVLLSDESFEVTRSFLREARDFCPTIGIEDLYQALRNVWIMNSLQLFRDEPIRYTPSIFAYSMLYPYTDNPLDDATMGAKEKAEWCLRLRERLAGANVMPTSRYEADVFRLISRIEVDHPRNTSPDVFESLLAIHGGQIRSLGQQRGGLSPYETDLVGISCEKGGTSVMTDGYLVAGSLSSAEEEFDFDFGVVLQLLDERPAAGRSIHSSTGCSTCSPACSRVPTASRRPAGRRRAI